jgi:glycosyltransferase involved in cell wall biosynthesis
MNEFKYYLLFNPELRNLNRLELKNSYLKDIETNNRITSIESFFKKYPKFDISEYKKKYNEVANFTYIDILIHANKNIVCENSISSSTPLKTCLEEDNEIILPVSIKTYSEVNLAKSEEIYMQSSSERMIIVKNKNIKLAHIFVHFFKIGGGECYISNFNKYNNIFDETLFVNYNYSYDTLFKYDSKIVYYKSYEELNLYLKNFDIIIDHQLYWFDKKISNEVFLNINHNLIINIIHGVPIHSEDITDRNFYYSIELYNDINCHNSWNNHIKIYNAIGVKIPQNLAYKNFNNNNINIAIVGRINEEKVPLKFLNTLIRFLDYNKDYKFNFYGVIDENYLKIFHKEIKKNKNILYHGIIDPSNISNIYTNNDILFHPSLYEAGATVVLEAMSYGLPVICRNSGGLSNALNNDDYLCNNDNDFFEKLLKINNNNYYNISNTNRLKILNYNNEEVLFNNLINELKLIYDIESNKYIPNIIHYIYGLKKQTEEFHFVYYLSILSNVLINKPDVIYFHYQYLPHGYWWNKARKYIKLNYINANNITWGKKKIIKFAHKADKIRLDILYKYGGIYMDIDTITYQPYKDLLKYDFVIGIQEDKYKTESGKYITLYCNAILLSKKNSIFIKEWIGNYEKSFNPDGWCEASVHLPYYIFKKMDDCKKENIKILEKEYFYYPSYNEVDKIFENNLDINNNLLTLHLWNTYSEKYYSNINNFDWCFTNDSLYSKLIKNILNKYAKCPEYFDHNIISKLQNKIFNISIILYEDQINDVDVYNKALYSILNQNYIYMLNIEIIIIHNNFKIFNNSTESNGLTYDQNNILKREFYEKNIDIKIIKLNKTVNRNIALNIGIKYSKNNLIYLYNINLDCNNLIERCLMHDSCKNNSPILSDLYCDDNKLDIINKLHVIDILADKNICINVHNLLFNKELVKYYFPNESLCNKESNIIFTIMNLLDNNNIKLNNILNNSDKYTFNKFRNFVSNNIKDTNNNIKNIYFERIFTLLYNNYYNLQNNYLDYIESIINF